ncbi:hypothetical protein LHJ74_29915 [Streptomyces sp. N2-109]|uniref:Sugar kinase n=1 Tax=Streptomyces gossypii TaxID=2883101 RepID=A0ABT2K1M8_9ACTN|nr:hypothetical protein [Streptomyces gossypii]MCT2594074.1 hypothetical protein [Streptomyces gossypii]
MTASSTGRLGTPTTPTEPTTRTASGEPMEPRTQSQRSGQRPPRRPRHRMVTLLIVVLLIAIPAGYLVMSAFVSRQSGQEKQKDAALDNLTWDWPSKVQRRIYDVPLPLGSSYVAHYEANSWKTSSLHVQFRTTDKKLGTFLKEVGTERAKLEDGRVTITDKQAAEVGWRFLSRGHTYSGLEYQRSKSTPELNITVDTTAKDRPRVYVVSTVRFTGP